MAFNGSGVYQRLYSWAADAAAGVNIRSDKMDAEDTGFAAGLSNVICKDGQTTITGNLPMASFRHTGVGNAQNRTDYASAAQVQDGAFLWGGTAGGSANAITLTLTPAIAAYAAGQIFRFLAASANTGATTASINSIGAVNIYKRTATGPSALVGAEIGAGVIHHIAYDGTQFELIDPISAAVVVPHALLGVQYFTSNGTYTATSGTNSIIVELVGGGGSGSRGAGALLNAGGGGGAYASKYITSAFTGTSVTVGAGGAAATVDAAGGNNGGTTSWGAVFSAAGGSGGSVTNNGATNGGTATGGDINATGGKGYVVQCASVGISMGGASPPYGTGGVNIGSSAGVAGGGYGGGGTGSVSGNNSGAGAGGLCIVREFS